MIPIRGKNNKKNNFFIAALVLAFKNFFRPFLTFLRSLMPKKSTGMQKSHIRVVFQRLWFFGHFRPIQITVPPPPYSGISKGYQNNIYTSLHNDTVQTQSEKKNINKIFFNSLLGFQKLLHTYFNIRLNEKSFWPHHYSAR